MLECSTEKYTKYSNDQNVFNRENLSSQCNETFLSDYAPRKRIPKAKDRNFRTITATEGNLLLILLVHKLCTNTGFYTEMNPRKTRAQCLKNIKIGSPRNVKRAPTVK